MVSPMDLPPSIIAIGVTLLIVFLSPLVFGLFLMLVHEEDRRNTPADAGSLRSKTNRGSHQPPQENQKTTEDRHD